jgi:hypothetical protein
MNMELAKTLADAFIERRSPEIHYRRYGESYDEFLRRLAFYELICLCDYNIRNRHNWSATEVEKRSRKYQDKISPVYHTRKFGETWADFDLRMALYGLEE